MSKRTYLSKSKRSSNFLKILYFNVFGFFRREKSCGAVIYIKSKGKIKFLIIKHKNIYGGHWDFPKGHVEKGESEKQTALREIKEETGLTVELIPGFRQKSRYINNAHTPPTPKEVIYFLAESKTEKVHYVFDELDDHKWLSYEEAMKQLTHDKARTILAAANEFLKKN